MKRGVGIWKGAFGKFAVYVRRGGESSEISGKNEREIWDMEGSEGWGFEKGWRGEKR